MLDSSKSRTFRNSITLQSMSPPPIYQYPLTPISICSDLCTDGFCGPVNESQNEAKRPWREALPLVFTTDGRKAGETSVGSAERTRSVGSQAR